MKDTVFAPSFGNRPSLLVGRDSLLIDVKYALETNPGTKDRALILLGPRGIGKTVLLWEIADLAREKGYCVANPTIASDDMLDRIIEKINDDSQTRISGISVGAAGFSAGVSFANDSNTTAQSRLVSVARELTKKKKGLLILIDELQANSIEVRKLIVTYQEMVGEGLDVALIMAGLPAAVSNVLNDRVLTFLNRAKKTMVEELRNRDIYYYFLDTFGALGIKIDEEKVKLATDVASGSPYMMQLVGHAIVSAASEDGAISDERIERAIRLAEEDFKDDICATTLRALSERDIDFLNAMSVDDKNSKISEIAKRMGVTVDYAQKYRKRLVDAGVIVAAGRGIVEFGLPYLREKLREENI